MLKSLDELIFELNSKKVVKFIIKVSANSRTNSIDFCEDSIKIKVHAPAIEGRANKAIVEYLSEITGVAKSKIKIVNGEKSAIKTILMQL